MGKRKGELEGGKPTPGTPLLGSLNGRDLDKAGPGPGYCWVQILTNKVLKSPYSRGKEAQLWVFCYPVHVQGLQPPTTES